MHRHFGIVSVMIVMIIAGLSNIASAGHIEDPGPSIDAQQTSTFSSKFRYGRNTGTTTYWRDDNPDAKTDFYGSGNAFPRKLDIKIFRGYRDGRYRAITTLAVSSKPESWWPSVDLEGRVFLDDVGSEYMSVNADVSYSRERQYYTLDGWGNLDQAIVDDVEVVGNDLSTFYGESWLTTTWRTTFEIRDKPEPDVSFNGQLVAADSVGSVPTTPTPVPTPSALAGGLVLLGGLTARRRRRRS